MITWGYLPWNTANTAVDIYLLIKNGNSNTETKCKVQPFWISCLTSLRPTLGHWQGSSLTQRMLMTALFQVRPEGYREHRNEVGSESPTKCISGIRAGNLLILSVTYYSTVTLSLEALTGNVSETVGYSLASVFSRNYKSFLWTLNISHTLSQCYYFNFKGWEVLR